MIQKMFYLDEDLKSMLQMPAKAANPANVSEKQIVTNANSLLIVANPSLINPRNKSGNQGLAEISNRLATTKSNKNKGISKISDISSPKEVKQTDESEVKVDKIPNCMLHKIEAMASIQSVFQRLNKIWPPGLEPNCDAQDRVDFAAMAGDRDAFLESIRLWETGERRRIGECLREKEKTHGQKSD
ncbi:MAG: hypothetical protein ACP5I1_19005 [Candidatus Hinthialibacter sp.]